VELEAKMGKNENEIVVTVTMSPEERSTIRNRHDVWSELVETTLSFESQPRSIIVNALNRHVGLGELLRLLKPFTLDPLDVRDEQALQPSAPLGRWAWLRAKFRRWWSSKKQRSLPAASGSAGPEAQP